MGNATGCPACQHDHHFDGECPDATCTCQGVVGVTFTVAKSMLVGNPDATVQLAQHHVERHLRKLAADAS